MLLARLRRSHIHVVIARRGALPTRQRIIGTASDHGTRQKGKGLEYESYETSFVILNDFEAFSSNQSAVRTRDRYLTSLLQPAKSHVIISTQTTGEVHWCAPMCCHASSS